MPRLVGKIGVPRLVQCWCKLEMGYGSRQLWFLWHRTPVVGHNHLMIDSAAVWASSANPRAAT